MAETGGSNKKRVRKPKVYVRKAERTRRAMAKTWKLKDFEAMVAEDTLGQDPWDRLPYETELEYSRFRAYLTMAPTDGRFDPDGTAIPMNQWVARSTRRLSNHLVVGLSTVKDTAKKNFWTMRAECFDREIERQSAAAFLEEKRSAARRQGRLGARLQMAADAGLAAWERQVRSGVTEVGAQDIARLADVGVKIERLAHDKSTSNESTVTRFIYEGSKPKWMDADEDVTPNQQVTAGPLTQRLHPPSSGAPLTTVILEGDTNGRD